MSVTAEYKGITFEFPDGTTQEKIIDYLKKNPQLYTEQRKTGLLEDVGIGLGNVAQTGKTALDMLAGGAASLAGQTEAADSIYASMEERKAKREAELKQLDQGLGGKFISGVAAFAPMLAAAPLTGPIAAGTAMATMGALDTSQENLKQGASLGQAAAQFGIQAATDTAANLIPVGRGILRGGALGAGGNVVSQGVQDLTGNALMAGISPEITERYHAGMDRKTAEKYGLSAAIGAVPGAVFGRMNRAGALDSPHDLSPSGVKSLLTKGTTDPSEMRFPPTDAEIKIETDRIKQMQDKQRLPREYETAVSKVAELEQAHREIIADGQEITASDRVALIRAKQKVQETKEALAKGGFDEDIQKKGLDNQQQQPPVEKPLDEGSAIPRALDDDPDPLALADANREGLAVRSEEGIDTQGVPKAENVNQEAQQAPILEEFSNLPKVAADRDYASEEARTKLIFEAGEINTLLTKGNVKTLGQALDKLLLVGLVSKEQKILTRYLLKSNFIKEALVKLHNTETIDVPNDDGSIKKAYAFYDPADQSVVLGNFVDARTILHEAVHAATVHILHNNLGGMAAKKMHTLFKQYERQSIRAGTDGHYGFKDVFEFVAEAFTSPSFQAHLKSIHLSDNLPSGKGKSFSNLYEVFKNIVRQALNIPDTAKTALDEVLDTGHALIEKTKDMDMREAYKGVHASDSSNLPKKIEEELSRINKTLDEILTKDPVLDASVKEAIEVDKATSEAAEADQQSTTPLAAATKSPAEIESKKTNNHIHRIVDGSVNPKVPDFVDTLKEVYANPDGDRGILGRIGLRAAYEWFGMPQFVQFVQDKPLIRHAYAIVKKADYYHGELKRMALDGSMTAEDRLNGLKSKTISLSHFNNDKSVRNLANKATNVQWNKVMSLFEDGYAKGQEYDVTLAKAQAEGKLTDKFEVDFFKALGDMYKLLREYSNEKIAEAIKENTTIFKDNPQASLDFIERAIKAASIENKPGWFPAARKGDFFVMIRGADGTPFHVQFFRTSMEAKAFENKTNDYKKKTKQTFLVDPMAKRTDDDVNLTQLLEVLKERFGGTKWADTGTKQIEASLDAIAKFGQFGAHGEHRMGLSGYEGSKWFVSNNNQAQDWKNATFNSVDDFSSILNKRIISIYSARLMNDTKIAAKAPEQHVYARRLLDNAMSPLKFESEWAAKGVENTENFLREAADRATIKIAHAMGFKDWYPKIAVPDRTHGMFARMFYISALTTRPVFWINQAISSPLALRHVLRDGTTLDALAAAGKGWAKFFRTNDPEFIKAFIWAANHTEVFEPAFRNEINSLSGLDGNNASQAAKFASSITGEMQSGKADSISRGMSFAMMYEHYHAKGLRGGDLYLAAKAGTDQSMILYNRPNKAPIIQKLGLAGQAIAPLQTFATGQLGNFLADLKYASDNTFKGKREYLGALAPALSTILVTMAAGGLIGIPMIAEYEILRGALIAIGDMFGQDFREDVPSAIKYLLKDDKNRNLTHGVFSANLGLDVGSGQRWSPVISGALTGEEGVSSMFPAIAFASKIGDSMVTVAKYYMGKATEEQFRKASLTIQPTVGWKFLVDELGFDAGEREMNTAGKRNFASTPQTDMDRAGVLLGSKSLDTAITTQQNLFNQKDMRNLTERQQEAADLLWDAINKNDTDKVGKLIDQMGTSLKMDEKQIRNQIENIARNKALPMNIRAIVNGKLNRLGKSNAARVKQEMWNSRWTTPQMTEEGQ